MTETLAANGRVTDAIYDAGYSGPGRFYADAKDRLGMTPTRWRDGGRGETIRWATAETSLGTMLVAATGRGICRLSFDEDEAELRRALPQRLDRAGRRGDGRAVARTVAAVEAPERPHDLPLDVRGTAFQEAVWRELARIPPGESLSYAALAARAGTAAGGTGGGNGLRLEPDRRAHPLPPRPPRRRLARRLRLRARAQGQPARARRAGAAEAQGAFLAASRVVVSHNSRAALGPLWSSLAIIAVTDCPSAPPWGSKAIGAKRRAPRRSCRRRAAGGPRSFSGQGPAGPARRP